MNILTNNITYTVDKMKLKLFVFSVFLSFVSANAFAADNTGLRAISSYGKIRCGTDASAKALAYKDSDGFWQGYAVDWCKVFAKAILNRSDAFEIVDVSAENMEKAFAQDKIDIMIGAEAINHSKEYKSKVAQSALIAYDKQGILVRKKEGAKSLEDYKGEKMCIVNDTADLYNMQKYLTTYDLDISLLPSTNKNRAKEAFMLNRCNLITGNRAYLMSFHKNNLGEKETYEVVPEYIAQVPQYVFVNKDNQKLNSVIKAVVNAMQLADENDINSQNIGIIIGVNNTSLQNLLGDNETLWKSFELVNPKWVRDAVKEFGNFGEIYDRNFGAETMFKFERENNKIFNKGGLIIPQPFL